MSQLFDTEVDAVGLECPLPLLKTKQALNHMHSGQVLHIMTTDPGSTIDFAVFAQRSQNELLDSREENGTYHFIIRKN